MPPSPTRWRDSVDLDRASEADGQGIGGPAHGSMSPSEGASARGATWAAAAAHDLVAHEDRACYRSQPGTAVLSASQALPRRANE